MNNSVDPSTISQSISESGTLQYRCVNQISICNQSYMISMCVDNSEEPHIDLEVEAKENGDQWKSSFNAADIETMAAKTGNFKSFNIFVNMLKSAINQESSFVSIDLMTSDHLDLLREKGEDEISIRTTHLSNKRYLILIYNVEYDRIYYPLSLRYCGKPNAAILMQQIHQLTAENHLLKSRFHSNIEQSDINHLQHECSRLRKANDDYRQESLLNNRKEQEQQIDLLRQMIRGSEDALVKERAKIQKLNAKKEDHYKIFIAQIDLLKASERQLKVKVKHLTNEINLLNQNFHRSIVVTSSSKERANQLQSAEEQVASSSSNPRRCRSLSRSRRLVSSSDSRTRFNPTDYIIQKNLKLRQIECEKNRETRRRLNSARHGSDSDNMTTSKLNNNHPHTANSKRKSRQKRIPRDNQQQSKDSIDSDIERVSSPLVLRKGASNNSTILISHHDQQNPILSTVNNTIDIDERLKSLEKFFKQNLRR